MSFKDETLAYRSVCVTMCLKHMANVKSVRVASKCCKSSTSNKCEKKQHDNTVSNWLLEEIAVRLNIKCQQNQFKIASCSKLNTF